jgi:hypothetical protein
MGHSRFVPIRLAWLGAALLALATAAPASAQIQVTILDGRPQARGFSDNYPWFNDVPQYQGDQTFQYFLAYHPDIAQALAQNPGLLYNAGWRSEYPDLEEYLDSHPYEWQALNNANWSTGPAETTWGYYDTRHRWRDAYWWHENDPNWFYDNHMTWASLNSRWLISDGAYDQQNRWHYGEWWYNQNPGWVSTNRPNWLSQHRNWSNQSVQQSYRQQHSMGALNQFRQQASVQPRQNFQQAQQNQQRLTNQRQANVQQQQVNRQVNQQRVTGQRQNNVQQQQVNRQVNQRQQQANRQQGRSAQQVNHQQARPAPQASRQQARPQQQARQQPRGGAQRTQVARANKR